MWHDAFYQCEAYNLHRHGVSCECLTPEPSVQALLGWLWEKRADGRWYIASPLISRSERIREHVQR